MTETTTIPGLAIYDYAMFGYFGAYLAYAVHSLFSRTRLVGWIATGMLCAAWLLHTWFFVERTVFYWNQHGGFLLPATNMFEAVNYFAWMIVLAYLIAERVLRTRAFALFALLLPTAAVAYAARAMAADPRELFPSLKSYWLWIHVSCMFISYTVLFLSFVFALMYILRARGVKAIGWLDPKFNLKWLDTVSYKLVMIGFPVLTLGIFLGAVWADSAWGRYWGWDPKEVWALITWLIYLGYLHFRNQPGFPGYRSSLINAIGFVAVLITFKGVNLITSVLGVSSMHAYAEGGSPWMLTVLGLMLLVPIVMFFLPGPRERMAAEEPTAVAEEVARRRGEKLPERIDQPPGGPSGDGKLNPAPPAHKPESAQQDGST